jgi:hypothetical protein
MTQLNPPLWLYIPEFEAYGLAHFVENHGLEHHLYWTVFMDNGEIWTLPNNRVRAGYNNTLDRHEKNRDNGKPTQ